MATVEKCAWDNLFDDYEKNSLQTGFFIIGIISVVLGLWLNLTILMTKLRLDRSYKTLVNFTVTACVHRVVAMIPFANRVVRSDDFQPYCKLFAFLETFLAVLEVEWLTHVCIERYVVAKYVSNGWNINKDHYKLFERLCLFFACLYSFPPLLGFGNYGFDFSCTYYTFEMVLPDSWLKFVTVAIFFLRSIKPTVVIMTTLVWASVFEKKLKDSEENRQLRSFTQNIIKIALVNLMCWTPIALVRGGVVLSQLFYSGSVLMTSVSYIKWALWIHWGAPALTAITLLKTDVNIRKTLFNDSEIKDDDPQEQKEK